MSSSGPYGPSPQTTPPGVLPATPPPIDFGLDRLDTLNAMMAIHRQLGALEASVNLIHRDVRDLRERDIADLKESIKDQSKTISGIDKKLYAAAAILGLVGFAAGPVVTLFLQKVWGAH